MLTLQEMALYKINTPDPLGWSGWEKKDLLCLMDDIQIKHFALHFIYNDMQYLKECHKIDANHIRIVTDREFVLMQWSESHRNLFH